MLRQGFSLTCVSIGGKITSAFEVVFTCLPNESSLIPTCTMDRAMGRKQKSRKKIWTKNKSLKNSYLEFTYYFQILWQKVSKPIKNSKKDHSFYNTVLLKKPHPFYEPQLTQHYEKCTLATQQKTCFQLVSEKTSALHHFYTSKNCILGAIGK